MPKNYILCKDINGNPNIWGIINREKDCKLSSDDGDKMVDHLNKLYEENQQLKNKLSKIEKKIKVLHK